MKKYSLTAQSRTLVGRKTKDLRSQSILPATIYGKKVKSTSVQVKADEFMKIYKEAGETGLVELRLDKDTRPVLIHNVQFHSVSDFPLHVEFFQVDLKEKVKARVPVEFIGESPLVSQKQGVLLTLLGEIEVEALPADLPEKIEVNVSGLSAVDQELKVADLKVPSTVSVLSEPTVTVVKVGPLVSKEAEAEAAAEAAAAAAKAAEASEVPAEGAPTEEAGKPQAPAATEEKTKGPEEKSPEEKK